MKQASPLKYILSLLLILPLGVFSQSRKADSLKTVLKSAKDDTNKVITLCEYAKALASCGCDSGNLVINKSLEEALMLSGKLNYQYGKGLTLFNKGYLIRHTKPDTALLYLLEALKIVESMNRANLQFSINSAISGIYYYVGNYSGNAAYAYKNLKIAEDMHDSEKLSYVYNQLGNLYSDEHDSKNAIKYHSADLNYEIKHHDSLRMSYEYVNLGIDYLATGKYDSVIYFSNKAMFIQIPKHNEVGQAYSLDNIGEAYIAQNDYKKALDYLLKANGYLSNSKDNTQKAETWNDLGKVYFQLKDYPKALDFYSIAKTITEQKKIYQHLINAYSGLSSVYEATHKQDSALKYYKLYSNYKDTVFNSEKANKIASLAYQYNHDKEEKNYQFETEKKELAHQAEIKRNRILLWAFIAGVLLLLLVIFYIYRNFRIKHKTNIIISKQMELVEEKNKEILDSITYAKRLQDAILPPLNTIKQLLPDSFVLYKPKDIVAGDFYWMEQTGDTILIAAADCTGHGVPGAMVSVVCSNALNRTVKEFRITEPGKILDKVRELVLETFEKSESEVQDGMDISLCAINKATKEVKWSGANNPLWYIQDNELKEIVADKQPIGKFIDHKPFSTHTLSLKKGDTLFLFTDGYADQFGGPKGKKFKYKPLQEKLLSMASLPIDKQKELLEQTLDSWKGNLEQVDDVLVIGIRV